MSQDGEQVAYVALSSARPRLENVSIWDVHANRRRQVFEAGTIWSISWAPGGRRLAVIADRIAGRERNLYVVDLNSMTTSQLSHGPLQVGSREYSVSNTAPPSWNQDGSRLAVETRSSSEPSEQESSSILVWELATNQFWKLSDGVDPAWSPAGDVIAFFSASRQTCFTIKPDGSGRTMLFSVAEGKFGSNSLPLFFPVVWSPDGMQLIFHQWVEADLVTDVYRFDLKTGKPKRLGRTELQVVNWSILGDRSHESTALPQQ
jgi:Tol biopolymer transport system component